MTKTNEENKYLSKAYWIWNKFNPNEYVLTGIFITSIVLIFYAMSLNKNENRIYRDIIYNTFLPFDLSVIIGGIDFYLLKVFKNKIFEKILKTITIGYVSAYAMLLSIAPIIYGKNILVGLLPIVSLILGIKTITKYINKKYATA